MKSSVNFLYSSYTKIHWSVVYFEWTFYQHAWFFNVIAMLLENIGSLSYADLSNADMFLYTMVKTNATNR